MADGFTGQKTSPNQQYQSTGTEGKNAAKLSKTQKKQQHKMQQHNKKQESPAIADKPARRESLPKIAPIRRAYNVVADNTGLSSCV